MNKENNRIIIGQINKKIYDGILSNKWKPSIAIVNNDIVVPANNIEHIAQRHGNIYERYKHKLPEIINKPDYVFAGQEDNRVIVVRKIPRIEVVLELSIKKSYIGNKVVTMFAIKHKDIAKLKNKCKILYKRK